MTKHWKTIVPILMALIIAAVGSYWVSKWIGKQTSPTKAAAAPSARSDTVSAVVAASDLSAGALLSANLLKTASFLKESLPAGTFSGTAPLEGRVLTANIRAGETILEHRLAPVDVKTGGVSAVIPQGKRAVAVRGDKVIGISGLINPGNRVDVMMTITDDTTQTDHTKTVLENIPVLAAGSQMEKNGKGEPSPVDVYTLEVTPEESEKLTLAASEGKLQFALRNAMDREEVLTRGATVSETLKSFMLPVARGKAEKPTGAVTSAAIEVIKGNTREKVTF